MIGNSTEAGQRGRSGAAIRAAAALACATCALVVVDTAAAKGQPTALRLCGRSTCATITNAAALNEFVDFAIAPTGPAGRQPLPMSFDRVRVRFKDGEAMSGYYLPSAGMLETASVGLGFVQLPHKLATLLARALVSVQPFPPPPIHTLVVDGRTVRDPVLAGALFGNYPQRPLSSTVGRWIEIDIGWASANPWSSEGPITYHVGSHTLLRGDGPVHLPAELAARIVADAGATKPSA